MDTWIKAKDKLPDKEGRYLVYAKSENPNKPFYAIAFWDKKDWIGIPSAWASVITHWMIPEPPKDDK